MCCTFVPRTLFQRFADDESLSEDVREAARISVSQIEATLTASESSMDPTTSFQTRYTKVPGAFDDFRCVIYSMATKSYEESNVGSTSYAPLPGIRLRSQNEEPVVNHDDVNTCMANLKTTYDFFKRVFNRNSVDDKGLQLEASIHYALRHPNASWEPSANQMVFGDGDGNSRFDRRVGIFNNGCFVRALDIVAHELTHAVTQYSAGLKYQGQSGALNESMSDVFGVMVVQWKKNQTVEEADWVIGKDVIYQDSETLARISKNAMKASTLRSMQDPESKSNVMPQPAHMKSKLYQNDKVLFFDYGGVHTNSGVPNHAFYQVAMALGGYSWERAGKIWYAVLTDPRLGKLASFKDFAELSIDQARMLFPEENSVATSVEMAWKEVGVL